LTFINAFVVSLDPTPVRFIVDIGDGFGRPSLI
jgi:hypothetical protein